MLRIWQKYRWGILILIGIVAFLIAIFGWRAFIASLAGAGALALGGRRRKKMPQSDSLLPGRILDQAQRTLDESQGAVARTREQIQQAKEKADRAIQEVTKRSGEASARADKAVEDIHKAKVEAAQTVENVRKRRSSRREKIGQSLMIGLLISTSIIVAFLAWGGSAFAQEAPVSPGVPADLEVMREGYAQLVEQVKVLKAALEESEADGQLLEAEIARLVAALDQAEKEIVWLKEQSNVSAKQAADTITGLKQTLEEVEAGYERQITQLQQELEFFMSWVRQCLQDIAELSKPRLRPTVGGTLGRGADGQLTSSLFVGVSY